MELRWLKEAIDSPVGWRRLQYRDCEHDIPCDWLDVPTVSEEVKDEYCVKDCVMDMTYFNHVHKFKPKETKEELKVWYCANATHDISCKHNSKNNPFHVHERLGWVDYKCNCDFPPIKPKEEVKEYPCEYPGDVCVCNPKRPGCKCGFCDYAKKEVWCEHIILMPYGYYFKGSSLGCHVPDDWILCPVKDCGSLRPEKVEKTLKEEIETILYFKWSTKTSSKEAAQAIVDLLAEREGKHE